MIRGLSGVKQSFTKREKGHLGWVLRNERFSVEMEKSITERRKIMYSGVWHKRTSTGAVPDTRVSTLGNREGINQFSNLNRNINTLSCVRDQSRSCPALHDSIDCSLLAPLSMEFSRQESWTGLPSLPPEDLPNPGTECLSPAAPALAGRFFTTEPPGKPIHCHTCTELAGVSQFLMLLCLTCTQMTLTMLYRYFQPLTAFSHCTIPPWP